MNLKLKLNNITVNCIVGERPDERVREQELRVDVDLEIGDAAAVSDRLEDTVDYAALADRIRAAIAAAKCRMIERAAKVACDVCLAEAKACAATVTVTKAGAVPGLGSASVTCSGRGGARP